MCASFSYVGYFKDIQVQYGVRPCAQVFFLIHLHSKMEKKEKTTQKQTHRFFSPLKFSPRKITYRKRQTKREQGFLCVWLFLFHLHNTTSTKPKETDKQTSKQPPLYTFFKVKVIPIIIFIPFSLNYPNPIIITVAVLWTAPTTRLCKDD